MTVTAATKQSGNEIGNFLKFVLPRLTSQPAQDALNMIGVSLTNQNGDLRDAMEIYSDVADKFQDLSKMEQGIVSEGLAGKHHISRMTALLTNMDLYNKMLNNSIDSTNSARNENEVFLESLQARINILKSSWQELSLAMGEAFLTNDFIAIVELLKSMAETAKNVTNDIGVLPPVLAAVGIATGLLSTRFKTLVFEANATGRAFQFLGVQSKFLKLALASTGLGLGLIAVGAITEKIIAKMAEAREKTEEFNREQKKLTDNYKEHKDEINSLVVEYENYSDIINNIDYTTDDLKKYNEIKNKLAELIPELVLGEDQYGNKILSSSESIRAKTEMLQRQLEVQERLARIEAREKAEENYAFSSGNLSDVQNQFDNFFDGKKFNNIDRYIQKVEELEEKQLKLRQQGDNLNYIDSRNLNYYNNIIEQYEKLQYTLENVRSSHYKTSMDLIKNSANTEGEINKSTESLLNDFLIYVSTIEESGEKIRSSLDAITNDFQTNANLKPLFEDYSKAIDDYNNAIDSNLSSDKIKEYEEKVKKAFSAVKSSFIDVAEARKFDADSYNQLEANMDSSLQSVLNMSNQILDLVEKKGMSVAEARAHVLALGDEAGALDNATSSMDKLNEQYESAISNIQSLQSILDELNESNELSAESINKIVTKYPELLAYMGNHEALIEQIKTKQIEEKELAREAIYEKLKDNETFFNEVRGGYEQLVDDLNIANEVDLENFKSLASAKLEVEQGLIKNLAKMWSEYFGVLSDESIKQYNLVDTETGQLTSAGSDWMKWLPEDKKNGAMNAFNQYQSKLSEARKRMEGITFDGIGVDFDKVTLGGKSPSKSQSKSSSKADQPSYTDPIDAIIAQINAESDLLSAQQESTKALINHYNKTKYYNKELEATNRLISEQEQRIGSLQFANSKIHEEANKVRSSSRFKDTEQWFNHNAESTVYYEDTKNNASKSQQEEMEKVFSKLQKLKKAYNSNKEEVNSLEYGMTDLNVTLEQLKFDATIREIEKFDNSISKLEHTRSLSESMMSMYDEGTEEYNNELQRQISLTQQIQSQLASKKAYLESMIASVDKGSDAWNEYTGQLQDVQSAMVSAEKYLFDMRSSINEQIIDAYKKVYEQQRDIAINAIEDELQAYEEASDRRIESMENEKKYKLEAIEEEQEALDKAHKERTKQLEDEYKLFEENVQKKLRLLDDQASEDDYNKQLAKMQNERQDVQSQIDVLSMDDSVEAKARRAELQKQLSEKDESIEEFQTNRSRELRKQNLNDQLENFRKEIDEKRKIEDDKYEAEKESLDKRKEATERYYDNIKKIEEDWVNERKRSLEKQKEDTNLHYENLINDERKWTEIRKMDMAELQLKVQTDFLQFKTFLGKHSTEIGNSLTNNIIDTLDEMIAKMQAFQAMASSTGISSGGVSYSGGSSKSSSSSKSGSTYDDLIKPVHDGLDNTRIGTDGLTDYTREMRRRAIEAGGEIGSFDTGGYTGTFGKEGRLAFLHEKELVLNKVDTSNILKAVDLTRNFINGIKTPEIPNATNNNNGITIQVNPEMNISLGKGIKDLTRSEIQWLGKQMTSQVSTGIVDGLKKLGKK